MAKHNLRGRHFDTQTQLTRLHQLVARIQEGDYPSQKVLAEEWECCPRTIQSDLDFIRDVWELPLYYDNKRYGFYFSEPVANFPMIPISERELVSVFVAQKALRPYHGTPFEAPLRSAFQKLVSSLQGEISVKWEDLDSAISFRGIEVNAKEVGALAEISGAIRSRREVEFEYWKLESSPSPRPSPTEPVRPTGEGGRSGAAAQMRRVRPYHLACIGGQWYLFGYDLMRQDIRKFVPGRMKNLRVLYARFERPANFSVDKLLKGSFGVFSGGKLQKVKIWFDAFAARLVKEKRWHQSQQIRRLKKGEIEVTFELSSFVEIVPWILGWGRRARAVGPKALVEEVKEEVRSLKKMY
jgi:predicted DNA-binding transcriptional regulator YafY